MSALMEAQELAKSFGGLTALRSVSFRLMSKEVVGLIGPNGSGKTTLFNLVSGVFPADRGKVLLEGEDITGLKAYQICRKGVGRTFQIVRPFLKMTCLENVLVGVVGRADHHRRSREAMLDEAMAELEFVGLAHMAARLAGSLTLIQKKQLEMARALVTRPRVLLLDEVLAGLNPSEVLQALELIEEIRSRRNITVFWIEHVMGAIMRACDRVIVLDRGEKIAEGPPEQVVSDNRVIQAYLGESDA